MTSPAEQSASTPSLSLAPDNTVPSTPDLNTERTFRLGPSGGHGGEAFEQRGLPGMRPIGVAVRHAALIDAVSLIWPNQKDETPAAGGEGGTLTQVMFADGETLVQIRGRHGAHLDGLELTTSAGQVLTFGGPGGTHEFAYDVPTGTTLTGLFGRAGIYLDALGIILTAEQPKTAPAKKPGARKPSAKKPVAPNAAEKPAVAKPAVRKKNDPEGSEATPKEAEDGAAAPARNRASAKAKSPVKPKG